MLIIILILFFLIINIFSFFLFRSNLLNPMNIYSIGFLISSISLYMAKNTWNVELLGKTVYLIILGSISYFLGIILTNIRLLTSNSHENTRLKKNSVSYKYLIKDNVKIISIIFIILQLLTTVALYVSLRGFYPGGTISDMISYYRNTAMSDLSYEVQLPFIVNQSININMSGSFVLLFVFFYGRIFEQKKISYLLTLPILFYIIQSILMGGRLQIIRVLIFLIISSYFMYMYKNKSLKKTNRWIVSKSKWLIVFLPVFYSLKFFIGRSSTGNFLQYIIRYLGGPIESFDVFLRNGIFNEHLVGQETFSGLYSIINDSPVTFRWAQSLTGIWVGNVFTGIRRYYADFGITGVFVIMFLLGLIFGISYYFIFSKTNHFYIRSMFSLIFYSFFSYSILFEFFDDTFMTVVVTMGGILKIVELYIFYKLMIKKQYIYNNILR